jgi:phosphoribosylformylglycinamidine synthase I
VSSDKLKRSASRRSTGKPDVPVDQDRTARPRVLIITGDGLNCERETSWAFTMAGADCDLVHIGDILNRVRGLTDYDALAFIGGFSNGDHLGAGTVQASRFRHSLKEDLQEFIDRSGPIIGICNGFQTLVKMGILPGVPPEVRPAARRGVRPDRGAEGDEWRRNATIMANDSGRFEDRWVHLAVNPDSPCIWTRGLKRLFLPVRHGEGKFYMADPELLDRLESNNQVVARYAAAQGEPTLEYPENPNGSQRAVAAVCDPSGLIFGLMPHPEAFSRPYHHPSWTRDAALGRALPPEGEGLAVFRNAVTYLRGKLPSRAGKQGKEKNDGSG